MITPSEIKQKCLRRYPDFLREDLNKRSIFPLQFSVGKVPDNFADRRDGIALLRSQDKETIGYGYATTFRQTNTRNSGQQTIPVQITIADEQDFLRLIGKTREVATFRENCSQILRQLPQLQTWVEQNPLKVIEFAEKWSSLIHVCQYFIEHPQPNLYIRELPIPIHTKFISDHQTTVQQLLYALLPDETYDRTASTFERKFGLRYDEPQVRFRFLDDELRLRMGFPVSDMAIPISEFKALRNDAALYFIIENKMTFLAMPFVPNSLAIFGEGFKVTILSEVERLKTCNIYYWGDLDAQGYQILHSLRSHFPQTVSLMMDDETYQTFEEYAHIGTPHKPLTLSTLTPNEERLYNWLVEHSMRLEQEHIAQHYVLKKLRMIGLSQS